MTWILHLSALVFVLISLFVYFVKPLDAAGMREFGDLAPVVASLFALALMIYAINTFSKRDKQRLGWILLTLGIGLYFLGEASWAYLELVIGKEVPFPSIADLFWLTGYVPLFVGLLLVYRRLAVKLTRRESAVFYVFGFVLVLLAYYFLFAPIFQSGTVGSLEKHLDLIYPVWDIFLTLPALAVLLVYGRGLLGRTWLFVSLGFLLFTFADLVFSYLTWVKVYQTGNPVDLAWIMGYILIALAAITRIGLAREMRLAKA